MSYPPVGIDRDRIGLCLFGNIGQGPAFPSIRQEIPGLLAVVPLFVLRNQHFLGNLQRLDQGDKG